MEAVEELRARFKHIMLMLAKVYGARDTCRNSIVPH